MQLSEYLAANRIRLRDLAEKVGISAPSLSKLANGVNSPRLETARKISEATAGEVTAEDFMQRRNGDT